MRICPRLLRLRRLRLSRCISCTDPCTNLVPERDPVTDSLTLDRSGTVQAERRALLAVDTLRQLSLSTVIGWLYARPGKREGAVTWVSGGRWRSNWNG